MCCRDMTRYHTIRRGLVGTEIDIFDVQVHGILNIECHAVIIALANVGTRHLSMAVHLLTGCRPCVLDHLEVVLCLSCTLEGAAAEYAAELLAILQCDADLLSLRGVSVYVMLSVFNLPFVEADSVCGHTYNEIR